MVTDVKSNTTHRTRPLTEAYKSYIIMMTCTLLHRIKISANALRRGAHLHDSERALDREYSMSREREMSQSTCLTDHDSNCCTIAEAFLLEAWR